MTSFYLYLDASFVAKTKKQCSVDLRNTAYRLRNLALYIVVHFSKTVLPVESSPWNV